MKSPEYDEIDALLAEIDVSSNPILDDDEVDEVDALLGGIDDDFISPKEQIYLSNKQYLADTPQSEVDDNFIKLQDEMISNVEDILEDYSGGSMTGEHFGLDQEYDELDALESDLDDMLLGLDDVDCHECGSPNVHDEGCSQEEFGGLRSRIRNRNERAVINRKLRKNRRELRKEGRKSQRSDRQEARGERREARRSNRQEARGERIEARSARRSNRQEARGERIEARSARRSNRQEAFIASKRRYLRLVTSFKKACLKFRKLRIRKAQQKNAVALVGAPAAMAISPFSVMTAGMVSSFSGVMDTMDEAFGLAKPGVVSRVRRRRREKQILRAAKACDQKYNRLVKVWNKLNRLGNTAGLQSPHEIVGKSSGWLKDVAKKARKVRMTRAEKSRMRRAKLISKRKLKDLREERKRTRRDQLKRRQSIVASRLARQQALAQQKKQSLIQQRQNRIDGKAEARSEYDALLAQTSYINEADLAALERAAIERKKTVLPPALLSTVMPPALLSTVMPRRRNRRPLMRQPVIPIRRRTRRKRRPFIMPPLPSRSIVRRPRQVVRPVITPPLPIRSVVRRPRQVVRPARPVSRPVRQPKPRISPIAKSSATRRADLEKKIKITQQKLNYSIKLHKKALDSKKRAEARGLKPIIVKSHYADVKKYAQQSTDLREVLKGYKIQLSLGRR